MRVGGGGEDRAVVVLQHLNPRGDVGGVIVADLRGEFKIGAEESGTQLGDQLLAGVTFVAPAFAAEITIKAGRMLYPVTCLMGKGRVKAFSVGESLNRRHLDVVEFLRVVGLAAPVADIGARGREERLGVID